MQISGTLRIADRNGEALVTARKGRLAIRTASPRQSIALLGALGGVKQLPRLAALLDRLGLTLSLDARVGLKFVFGRDARPGPIQRVLGARRFAITV